MLHLIRETFISIFKTRHPNVYCVLNSYVTGTHVAVCAPKDFWVAKLLTDLHWDVDQRVCNTLFVFNV